MRLSEEKDIQLTVSIYDTVRNAAKIASNEDEQANKNKEDVNKAAVVDYLSPFLVNISNANNFSREEAIQIRDNCLKALKERLIEKAQIIQARNDAETAAYQRRQLEFQRRQDTMTAEEHEEYRNFCNDALFRIHILERRLNKVCCKYINVFMTLV